ncbi:Aste57867_17568 [Aphanomyces stellatus]|uniref:Aste57867_17568 protein n=1 Tax=Aphanomyces stellatus TaxID=120398 RepID=A0A485L800_9STRA|nr:hypothetical protein As57867_017508 [Aphanomyces stellatus]VFT94319.1 Aste57867_17568 [Aphanomyces stellatus]
MASYNPNANRYGYASGASGYPDIAAAHFPPPTTAAAPTSQRMYTSPVKSLSAGGVFSRPLSASGNAWMSPSPNGTRMSPLTSPLSSELTSTAAPFVPKHVSASPQSTADPLVQVTRGGCIFYVPESEATTAPNPGASNPHASLHVDVHPASLHVSTSSGIHHPSSSAIPSSMSSSHGCDYRPIVATRRSLASLALAPSIRRQLDQQHEEMVRQVDPSDERYKEIPSQFVCMWPLDDDGDTRHRNIAGSFGYPSHAYKVLSETDGRTYALRRIENVRTTPEIVQQAVDTWKRVGHAALVPLHRAFVSHGALFFLCEFYPGAVSLQHKFLSTTTTTRPTEALLWAILTQVCAALRVVHGANLACKAIHPRRLLLTAHDRIRITGVGVLDVLEYDSLKSKPRVDTMQREDILSLGKAVLSLATLHEWHPSTQNEWLADMQHHYSPSLCHVVALLVDQNIVTVRVVLWVCATDSGVQVADLSAPLQDHLFATLDHQHRLADEYEHQLASEYQNGRMLLLLMKLGLVNERPDLHQDRSWAETGDRYLLQLFRDYVFHQVDEANRPVVDFGHVVDCLNKLDSAAPEKILLSSRDGQSILVASYAEVHRCVQNTFSDLLTAAQRRPVHITPVAKSHVMASAARGGRSARPSRGGGRGRGRGSEN